MRDTFGFDHSPVSVYSITLGIDEARTIAAHYLTLKRDHIRTVWALRIEQNDLNDLDIEANETPGDIGIIEFNAKHRDLISNISQFEMLTERLHNAIRRGEDRLRTLEEIQIEYLLQEFLALDSSAISDHAKDSCRKALRI